MSEHPLTHKILAAIIAFLTIIVLLLWQNRIDLSKTNKQQVQDFYVKLSNSQVSFTDSGDFIFPGEQKFLDLRKQYINSGERFVELNLRTKQGALYEQGAKTREFKILAKGREGTWWETPTGSYRVINKEYLHFSKLAKVWMPYSTQFYGSFFIHAWPFYQDGRPIPSTVSGSLGCIRLANEDAKAVFEFSGIGTRVLVLEEEPAAGYGRLVSNQKNNAVAPATTAASILVANLATGETIIKKDQDESSALGTLTKFMTALIAADLLNPEQEVKVSAAGLAEVLSLFQPQIGEDYTVLDLLYPLLIQGSDEAASILADFIGAGNLITNMNSKAKSLQMTRTKFSDFKGNNTRNVSSAQDWLKVLQHVFHKRSFLFDISKGKEYFGVGPGKFGISNLNSFYDEADLVGIQGGKLPSGHGNMMSVWWISGGGKSVPVAVVVLGSEDAASDTKNLLDWVRGNFEVL